MKTKLLAGTAALVLSAGFAQAQEKTLTISVYAFAQDEFKEIVYDPFEAQCGCKLVVETGNSVERLAKIEANKASPVIDMAVVSMADGLPKTSDEGPPVWLQFVVRLTGSGKLSSDTVASRETGEMSPTLARRMFGARLSGTTVRLENLATFSTPAVPPALSTAKPTKTRGVMMMVRGEPS